MSTEPVTTLTSRQRVLAAIRRQPVDCVVAMPYMYDIAPINTGVALRDYYTILTPWRWRVPRSPFKPWRARM